MIRALLLSRVAPSPYHIWYHYRKGFIVEILYPFAAPSNIHSTTLVPPSWQRNHVSKTNVRKGKQKKKERPRYPLKGITEIRKHIAIKNSTFRASGTVWVWGPGVAKATLFTPSDPRRARNKQRKKKKKQKREKHAEREKQHNDTTPPTHSP